MADLEVDYDLLHDSVRSLVSIRSELDALAEGDLSATDWNHTDLNQASRALDDQLAQESKTLQEAVDDTGDWLETVISEFEELDASLADRR